MKIGMIGVGKLGMPCALAINQKGHDVMAYDVAKECMQKESFKHREIGPNGEPSIEPMLKESTIQFGSMQDVVDFADIIFVSVQTPHLERYEGTTRLPEERVDFNYSYLKDSIEQLSECVEKNGNDKTVIVISTVLPGTMRREIMPLMSEKIKLCYNPFFIAMGTTMQDFLNPEFILFGVYDDGAAAKAEEFYKTITNAPFFKTSIESAEAIKVFYNTYITGKITMMNAVMEVCHKIPGADCDEVTRALSLATKRIVSPSYMYGGMGDGGGCLLPEEIVITEDGPKQIQNVQAGDMVLCGSGKFNKVVETYKRPYKGVIKNIKARNLLSCRYTPEHPLHLSADLRRKYETTGLTKWDTSTPAENMTGDIKEIDCCEASNDYYSIFPIPKQKYNKAYDDNYMRLAGYYLSEGCIRYGRDKVTPMGVAFYFNTKEKEYHKDVAETIKKLTGCDCKIYHSRRNCTSIRFYNKAWASKIVDDFGEFSEHKKIPKNIVYGPIENCEKIILGLFRGDGCNGVHGNTLSTISVNIAYSVFIMLKRLGIKASLTKIPARFNGFNHKVSYEVDVRNASDIEKLSKIVGMPNRHKMQDKRYKIIFDIDGNDYHRILKSEDEQYEGTVFNLNVENEHNYVTSAGLVSNCHPRDNIALSWLAKELSISYDWWENLMLAREKQTEWLADYILSFAGPTTGGMITILGKAFKPETNLTVGSPAILLRNLIAEKLGRGVNPDGISMYDPYIDDQKEKKHALLSKRVYFIATKHEEFKSYRFPSGSIVIDPWRYIPKSYPDVKYIYIGVGVNGR